MGGDCLNVGCVPSKVLIAAAIHPYPTQADAIRKLGDAYHRTRLTPTVKKLMSGILRWKR